MPLLESKNEANLKLFFNTRQKIILAMALIWGALAMIFLAIKPQIVYLFELNDNLEAERQTLAALKRKVQELDQIEFSQQFERKDKVDEVLPSNKPLLELLFNLNQAMIQTKASVTELKISPGKIGEEADEPTKSPAEKEEVSVRSLSSLSMDLTIKGEADRVDEFIELIEKIAPFTSIVELKLNSRSDPDSDKKTATAELVLNTYYYTGSISTSIEAQLPSVGDEELRVFDTIQKFRPSEFEPPTEIKESDVEDFFGIEGFEFNLD